MEKQKIWKSEYFYGNKISEYGLENGYIDTHYGTAWDYVLTDIKLNLDEGENNA